MNKGREAMACPRHSIRGICGLGYRDLRFLGLRIIRRRFDYVIRVTRTAGDGRKEGAKHIKT